MADRLSIGLLMRLSSIRGTFIDRSADWCDIYELGALES